MWEQGLQPEDARADRWWSSPLMWVAGAWVAGLLIGRGIGGTWVWAALASAFLLAGVLLLYIGRPRLTAAAVVLVVVAAVVVARRRRSRVARVVAEGACPACLALGLGRTLERASPEPAG